MVYCVLSGKHDVNKVFKSNTLDKNILYRSYTLIETSRLLLRKPDTEDFDIISEILSSPEQTKFLPNEAPYPIEKQQEYLANRIKHWALNGFGTFIVCLKEDPNVKLGFVGIEFAPNPEFVDIRYGISKSFEGKGYITEAAKKLLSWIFNNTEHTKVYGVSMPENLASIAIIKKLGMTVEDNVDLYNHPGLKHYSIEASKI